ncbi:MAG: M48 family metallopeptidase [Pseudomonadota bacterium]
MFLAACATPDYAPPPARPDHIVHEEKMALQSAVSTALQRRARVYDLSWPILTENVALCPKTRPALGLVLADEARYAKLAGGVREQDVRYLNIAEGGQVMHVHKNSPAFKAGLRVGDKILSVNGEPLTQLSKINRAIRASFKKEGPLRLGIETKTKEREVTISPVPICDMAVKISTSQQINAHAGTGDIVLYTGLIRNLNDAALQFVIAHEAAHIALRHPRKYMRNFTVTGAFVTGPRLYVGATLGDVGLRAVGQDPDISLKDRAVRAVAFWSEGFEAEADYVGLYFFARAGGNLQDMRQAFDVFAREAPRGIYIRSTHPLIPERLWAMTATINEIEAKKVRKQDLLPERSR